MLEPESNRIPALLVHEATVCMSYPHALESENLGSSSGLPTYKHETARKLLRSLSLSLKNGILEASIP